MKKLLKIVAVLVLIVVVGLVVVSVFFLGPTVRKAANTMGPEILGVPVAMGKTSVLPLRGELRLSELEIGNPDGFKSAHLFSMDKLSVDMKPSSVFSDTVVVKDVTISGVRITYETTGIRSNLGTLLKNLEKKGEAKEEPGETEAKEAADGDAPGKRIVIERVVLEDLKLTVAATLAAGKGLTLPLSRIEITGLGNKSGGLTAVEATTEIVKAITVGVGKSLTENSAKLASFGVDLTKSIGELGVKGIGAGAQIGAEAVKAAAGGLTEGAKAATEGLADGTKAVADGVADGAKAVTAGVTDGAKAVTDKVGDGAKAVTGKVGDGAKAVGEGAGKLLGGLKKIVPGSGDKEKEPEEKKE